MSAAAHQFPWLIDTPNDIIRIDPLRAAYRVTGIAFLCNHINCKKGPRPVPMIAEHKLYRAA
ncbi:hypothetical protein SBA_ch1_27970 [Sphingomonas bisphenolicum]|jgi:putative Mg2+ transporter-C (MgtC) family protein|uniref:Uncharacterized protein n=1 Tax=Sphingomonas bisphenolicum TaxID=296544 RepID=A0ABM7G6E6_9SPHN|nr:hypothetical protein SBA_ch1_27970 [Sphingomonas bisphenolicum]